MMDAGELRASLGQFTGTENYYVNPLFGTGFGYTDGVKFLAENAGAYWLIDIIGSYQIDRRVKAEDFQLWTLTRKGEGCVVSMTDGNDEKAIITQEVEFTDFPLETIKFYVCDNGRQKVCMLPSEY